MHTLKKNKPALQCELYYFYSCLQLLTPKAQPAHLRPLALLGVLQAAEREPLCSVPTQKMEAKSLFLM